MKRSKIIEKLCKQAQRLIAAPFMGKVGISNGHWLFVVDAADLPAEVALALRDNPTGYDSFKHCTLNPLAGNEAFIMPKEPGVEVEVTCELQGAIFANRRRTYQRKLSDGNGHSVYVNEQYLDVANGIYPNLRLRAGAIDPERQAVELYVPNGSEQTLVGLIMPMRPYNKAEDRS